MLFSLWFTSILFVYFHLKLIVWSGGGGALGFLPDFLAVSYILPPRGTAEVGAPIFGCDVTYYDSLNRSAT